MRYTQPMSLPALTFWTVIAAATPLLIVLYLMIGRNWGGSKAGSAGWVSALIISVLVFGANPTLLAVAFGRSLLLALYVLYIIWMALLLYHVVNDAGAIDVIGRELPGLAHDKPTQALLLGWVFGSFLQGASGFGVPAAVVAPLLVGLGFAANSAVVIALVGHAWAVTFGSLGSSFFSLMAATGRPGEALAGPSSALLGICCLLCGILVLWESGRLTAIRQRWLQLMGIGLLMAATQVGLALAGLWSLAAFGAGIAGLLAIVLDLRLGLLNATTWKERIVKNRRADLAGASNDPDIDPFKYPVKDVTFRFNKRELVKALIPYLLLTVIIILGQLVLNEALSFLTINPTFPEVTTTYGWITEAGPGRSISVFGHAGALLLYASILSFLWFRRQGTLRTTPAYSGRQIIQKTIKGSVKSTVGIVTLVAMAVTMQHAGMTQLLAEALSVGTGPVFPFLSPFIGALGAFMTGSNTNSNVVFGQLQQETAATLGLSIAFILAAQTAGGAIGSLFAPAKVIVGCSTVKGAEDSQVLKLATLYGLIIIAVIGVVVWLFATIGS